MSFRNLSSFAFNPCLRCSCASLMLIFVRSQASSRLLWTNGPQSMYLWKLSIGIWSDCEHVVINSLVLHSKDKLRIASSTLTRSRDKHQFNSHLARPQGDWRCFWACWEISLTIRTVQMVSEISLELWIDVFSHNSLGADSNGFAERESYGPGLHLLRLITVILLVLEIKMFVCYAMFIICTFNNSNGCMSVKGIILYSSVSVLWTAQESVILRHACYR